MTFECLTNCFAGCLVVWPVSISLFAFFGPFSVNRSQWQSLVKKLETDGLLPVVVFSFSKKKCQECADGLRSVTLTTAKYVSYARYDQSIKSYRSGPAVAEADMHRTGTCINSIIAVIVKCYF